MMAAETEMNKLSTRVAKTKEHPINNYEEKCKDEWDRVLNDE